MLINHLTSIMMQSHTVIQVNKLSSPGFVVYTFSPLTSLLPWSNLDVTSLVIVCCGGFMIYRKHHSYCSIVLYLSSSLCCSMAYETFVLKIKVHNSVHFTIARDHRITDMNSYFCSLGFFIGGKGACLLSIVRQGNACLDGTGLSSKKTSELMFIVNLLLCLVKVYPRPVTVYYNDMVITSSTECVSTSALGAELQSLPIPYFL